MIFRPDLLAGRAAIVTGGGTGIGFAIATELAKAGAAVTLAGRRADLLEEARAQLEAAGGRALAVPTNIRENDQVEHLVEETVRAYGRVDILVNNAGGQFPKASLDLTPNGWRAVVDTNLTGTFLCTRAVARRMVEQGGGAIINIIANFIDRGAPGIAHSAAARAGVANLTRTLALEWGKYNIRVNSVAPGIVETTGMLAEMAAHSTDPDFMQNLMESVPLRRAGRLDELGSLCVYLGSPAGEYITGQAIFVDGGHALNKPLTFVEI